MKLLMQYTVTSNAATGSLNAVYCAPPGAAWPWLIVYTAAAHYDCASLVI